VESTVKQRPPIQPAFPFSCKFCSTHHPFECIKDQKLMEEELMESEYLSPGLWLNAGDGSMMMTMMMNVKFW
jgi:hypothetical protein